VTDLVHDLGYLGLFLLMVGENLFPPIPSEVILPLAGFLVSDGEMSFTAALAASTAGSVAGALLLYAFARFGGRPAILRYARITRIRPEDMARAEAWFARRGPVVVLVARVLPVGRSMVSFPAGALRMGVVPFVVLTAIGSATWNAALIGAGWMLGREWERVSGTVGGVTTVLVVGVTVAVPFVLAWWWRRAGTRTPAPAPEGADGPS